MLAAPRRNQMKRRFLSFLATSLAALFILHTSPAPAQEPATERDAAREVIKKMDALEKSIAAADWVSKLTGPDSTRDQVVARARELMDKELLAMAEIGRASCR